jgi:hypothetical protein
MADKWICLSDEDRKTLTELLEKGHDDYVFEMAAKERLIKKLNPKRIKIASAKDKGRELQKRVCRDLSGVLDLPYDQQDDQCLVHAREMGQAGVDVILRGEAYQRFPFDVECKNTEQLSLTSAVHQAQANCSSGRDWLVVFKARALADPVAILSWSPFLTLARVLSRKIGGEL